MENQSDLNLANAALGQIGADRIVSLDNTVNSKTIQTVNLYLPLAKQATLRARDWNCVRGRKELNAVDANLSLGQWSQAYRLPDDFLCMRHFISDCDDVKFAKYSVEIDKDDKRIIFTDCGTNKVRYTRNVTDVNRWDSNLFESCWLRLAAFLAGPIVRDFKAGQMFYQLWREQNDEAVGINEGEGGHDRVYDDTLVNVRF